MVNKRLLVKKNFKKLDWKIILASVGILSCLICGYIFQLDWLKDPFLSIFGVLVTVIFQKLISKSEDEVKHITELRHKLKNLKRILINAPKSKKKEAYHNLITELHKYLENNMTLY